MDEPQVCGMQREPVGQLQAGRAIERVARDGVADVGEVYAELMRAACVQAQQNAGAVR